MVSAVITTHNRVDLLGRAIESVLNQTYKELELIVVSDGSTDGTEDFMKQYEADSRISFISYHPARGGNHARNTGIKASKGEYVAFLDDDDEWFPEKIAEQVRVMESDPGIGLVYTGTRSIFVENGVKYDSPQSCQGDLSREILFQNIVGSTTTVMVRKSVLEHSGIFDEDLGAIQDYDLWVRICQVAKVGVVSAPMVNYYNYGAGQISANLAKYETAYERVNEKYKDLLNEKLTVSERNHKYAGQKRSLAMIALRSGSGRTARAYLRKSLKHRFEPKTLAMYLMTFLGFDTLLKLRSLK